VTGVLFMSDLSVLYKSGVVYMAKGTTLFAEFKCFDYTPLLANN